MAGIVWSKRLAKLLVVAVLVAVTCVALGIWQIARLHQKQQFNAAVRAGLAVAPAPVDAVLIDGVDPDAVRYRRATATGTYDTEHGFVLYARTQDSQAGNHLLTPLMLSDGRAILVDRGWVPLDVDEPGAPEAAPPSGAVDVEGVLFSSEGDLPGIADAGSPVETTLSRLDLGTIQAQLPYPIEPSYLLLQGQTPAQPDELPEPASLPELSEGPHLSYAIQWFTFAAIAIAGCGVLALREGRDPRAADDRAVG